MQPLVCTSRTGYWIPAFAGMTENVVYTVSRVVKSEAFLVAQSASSGTVDDSSD